MTIPQVSFGPIFQAFNVYEKAKRESSGGNDPLLILARTGLSIAEIGVNYVASADQAAAKDRVTDIERRFQDAALRYTLGPTQGGINVDEYKGELDALRSELQAAKGTARTEYGREVFDNYEVNGFNPNYLKVSDGITQILTKRLADRTEADAGQIIEGYATAPAEYQMERERLQTQMAMQTKEAADAEGRRAAAEEAFTQYRTTGEAPAITEAAPPRDYSDEKIDRDTMLRYGAYAKSKGKDVPSDLETKTEEQLRAWYKGARYGLLEAFKAEDSKPITRRKTEAELADEIAKETAAAAQSRLAARETETKLAAMPAEREIVRAELEKSIKESRLLEGFPEQEKAWVEGKLRQYDERRITAAVEGLVGSNQFTAARETIEAHSGSFTSEEAKDKALKAVETQRAQYSLARDGAYMANAQNPFVWDITSEVKALRDMVGQDKEWDREAPDDRQETFNKLDRRYKELLAEEEREGTKADKFYTEKAREIVEARRRGDITTQQAVMALDDLKARGADKLPAQLWTDCVKEVEDIGWKGIPAGRAMMDRAEAYVTANKKTLPPEAQTWIPEETRKWLSANASASTTSEEYKRAEQDIMVRWYTKDIAKQLGLAGEQERVQKAVKTAKETIMRDWGAKDGASIAKGLAPFLGKWTKDGVESGALGSQVNIDPYTGAVNTPDLEAEYTRAQQFTNAALIQQLGISQVGAGAGSQNAVIIPHEDGSWHYNVIGKDNKVERVIVPVADESNPTGIRFFDMKTGQRATGDSPQRQALVSTLEKGMNAKDIISTPLKDEADYTSRQAQLRTMRDALDALRPADFSTEDREMIKAVKATIFEAERELNRKGMVRRLGYDPGGAYPAGSRGR